MRVLKINTETNWLGYTSLFWLEMQDITQQSSPSYNIVKKHKCHQAITLLETKVMHNWQSDVKHSVTSMQVRYFHYFSCRCIIFTTFHAGALFSLFFMNVYSRCLQCLCVFTKNINYNNSYVRTYNEHYFSNS